MVAVVADDEDVMRPREEGVGGAHLMCDDSPETFGGEESSGIHPWHFLHGKGDWNTHLILKMLLFHFFSSGQRQNCIESKGILLSKLLVSALLFRL